MNSSVLAQASSQASPLAIARTTVIFTCVLAALAGLMFGLDIGVISGATQFIQKDFNIDDRTIEWIVSAMMLGAAIGALGAARMSSALGRKKSLIIGAILFVIGSLLCGFAWSPETLIMGRIVLGLAIGIATFTAPLYLAEVAPQSIRGSMISLYQLMITIGILLAFLSDTAFSYSGNWRWMLGIIAIPGVLFLFGVLFLPDSPRWLMMQGHKDEAKKILQRLRGDEAIVAKEIADIEAQGWSLNPGRYVGVADRVADDFEFAVRLEELNEELETLNAEAWELEAQIAENVTALLERTL